jgi:hypothetical protein
MRNEGASPPTHPRFTSRPSEVHRVAASGFNMLVVDPRKQRGPGWSDHTGPPWTPKHHSSGPLGDRSPSPCRLWKVLLVALAHGLRACQAAARRCSAPSPQPAQQDAHQPHTSRTRPAKTQPASIALKITLTRPPNRPSTLQIGRSRLSRSDLTRLSASRRKRYPMQLHPDPGHAPPDLRGATLVLVRRARARRAPPWPASPRMRAEAAPTPGAAWPQKRAGAARPATEPRSCPHGPEATPHHPTPLPPPPSLLSRSSTSASSRWTPSSPRSAPGPRPASTTPTCCLWLAAVPLTTQARARRGGWPRRWSCILQAKVGGMGVLEMSARLVIRACTCVV